MSDDFNPVCTCGHPRSVHTESAQLCLEYVGAPEMLCPCLRFRWGQSDPTPAPTANSLTVSVPLPETEGQA